VVIQNRDVPGVIGKVGTILGDAGVNIGEYYQARLRAGGEALAAVSVDGRLAPPVVDRLQGIPDVHEVRQAQLD
jgi:D-3-phosphoglycerate dehydrogenase